MGEREKKHANEIMMSRDNWNAFPRTLFRAHMRLVKSDLQLNARRVEVRTEYSVLNTDTRARCVSASTRASNANFRQNFIFVRVPALRLTFIHFPRIEYNIMRRFYALEQPPRGPCFVERISRFAINTRSK